MCTQSTPSTGVYISKTAPSKNTQNSTINPQPNASPNIQNQIQPNISYNPKNHSFKDNDTGKEYKVTLYSYNNKINSNDKEWRDLAKKIVETACRNNYLPSMNEKTTIDYTENNTTISSNSKKTITIQDEENQTNALYELLQKNNEEYEIEDINNQFNTPNASSACTSIALYAAAHMATNSSTPLPINNVLTKGAEIHNNNNNLDIKEAIDLFNKKKLGSITNDFPIMEKENDDDDDNNDVSTKLQFQDNSENKNTNDLKTQLKNILKQIEEKKLEHEKLTGIINVNQKNMAIAITQNNYQITKIEYFDSHGILAGENNHSPAYYKVFKHKDKETLINKFCDFFRDSQPVNENAAQITIQFLDFSSVNLNPEVQTDQPPNDPEQTEELVLDALQT